MPPQVMIQVHALNNVLLVLCLINTGNNNNNKQLIEGNT